MAHSVLSVYVRHLGITPVKSCTKNIGIGTEIASIS